MINVKQAADRVEEIIAHRRDFEKAHALEDDLFFEVLKTIAGGGCPYPPGLARIALKARDVKFRRVCA